ncbi:MAG: hypothetical protein V1816_28630 [Pseudomonadota bacterium]
MPESITFWDCLAAAFLWRWNILALGAGLALAFIFGRPDVFVPLLAALEILFLCLLSTRPRFRAAVEAEAGRRAFPETDQRLQRMLAVLPKSDVRRFDAIRERCEALNRLGRQLRGLDPDEAGRIEEMQIESLNRLMWMFLKLLYSGNALDRFLDGVGRPTLVRDLEQTQKDLEEARRDNDAGDLARSQEDKLKTIEARLANYDRTAENSRLIKAELERIEQKINAVGEMFLSRRDGADISAEVDGISESITASAEALQTLDVMPEIKRDQSPLFIRPQAPGPRAGGKRG